MTSGASRRADAVSACAAPAGTATPPLLTGPLLVLFVSVVGDEMSFYLPLSVVPLYVKSSGSGSSAGLATGALLLAGVAGELATPWLVSRAGYRLSLAAGLALLGAPALALLWPVNLAVVVALCTVRGCGFAITTVAGGALTAALIPAERRGEGLGLYGVVAGVPALACLPAGVWMAGHWGYGPVFAVTAAAALLPLASAPALPGRGPTASQHAGEVLAGLRNPRLVRLALVFAASTVADGVLVTFLPLAVTTATAALFAQPAAATAARWAAGRIGDRHGQARLLGPGVLLAAAGMALLAAVHQPALVVGGAACFGIGFGILQNATLAMMYAAAPSSAGNTVSAIWNAAYDAGMGVGAGGIGLLAARTGYPAAFLVTAGLMLPALIPALRERAPVTACAAPALHPAQAARRRPRGEVSAVGQPGRWCPAPEIRAQDTSAARAASSVRKSATRGLRDTRECATLKLHIDDLRKWRSTDDGGPD